MITVTSLNGSEFVLNSSLIETLNEIPETKVTLTSGRSYLVLESIDEVVSKVIDYNKKIFMDSVRIK